MSDWRMYLGLLIAPLMPPGALAGLLAVRGIDHEFAWILWVGGSAVVSYASFVVVGLPTMAWLRRAHRLNVPTLIAAAAIGGATALLTVFGVLVLTLGMNPLALGFAAIAGAVFGPLVAVAFALIAGRAWMRTSSG